MTEFSTNVRASFDLSGRVIVITGGAGMLGVRHAEAVAEMGGTPVLFDVDGAALADAVESLRQSGCEEVLFHEVDITDVTKLQSAVDEVERTTGGLHGLINNAAIDPKMGAGGAERADWARVERFPADAWDRDLAVGLTGAFHCSRIVGSKLAASGGGAIVNIASDLALVGPDQRIYREEGRPDEEQPVKPISYSVVKSGLLGMTRYLATYWAEQGVRVNAVSFGGVRADQDQAFVDRLVDRIPMGRMARADEYKASIVFLLSDASSYMTGANLVVDGGRTCW